MTEACSDRSISPSRNLGSAVVVIAPAGDGAVGLHRAGKIETHTDGTEGTRWRCDVTTTEGSPASQGSIDPNATRTVVSRADRGEFARWWCRGTVLIHAQAGDAAVPLYATGISVTRFNRSEIRGRRPDPYGIIAPADDGAAGFHTAVVVTTRADGNKLASQCKYLDVTAFSPTEERLVGPDGAGIVMTRADGNETALRCREGSSPTLKRLVGLEAAGVMTTSGDEGEGVRRAVVRCGAGL
jgi:hypothetical protein